MSALDTAMVYYHSQGLYHEMLTSCETDLKSCAAEDQQKQQKLQFFTAYSHLLLEDTDVAIEKLLELKGAVQELEEEQEFCLFAVVAALIQAYLKKKDSSAAAAEKKTLKTTMKGSTPAGMYLAGLFFLLNDQLVKAKGTIERILGKDKTNTDFLALFGLINLSLANELTAAIDAEQADAGETDHNASQRDENEAKATKFMDKSNGCLKKALKLDKLHIMALYCRCQFKRAQPDSVDQSLQAANKMLQVDKTYSVALLERATLLMEKGQFEKALVTTKKCLKLDPANIPAYKLLFLDSLLQSPDDADRNVKNMKRLLKAIEKCDKWLPSSGGYVADLYFAAARLGESLARLNKPVLQTVEVGFRRATKSHAGNPYVLVVMAIHGYKLGRMDRCQKFLKKAKTVLSKMAEDAVVEGPVFQRTHLLGVIQGWQARLAVELDDYDTATELLQDESLPRSAFILYILALIQQENDVLNNRVEVTTLLQRALNKYKRVLAVSERSVDFYVNFDLDLLTSLLTTTFHTLGLADEYKKVTEATTKTAQTAAQEFPELLSMVSIVVKGVVMDFEKYPEAHLWLGTVHLLEGHTAQATEAFQQCLELVHGTNNGKLHHVFGKFAKAYLEVIKTLQQDVRGEWDSASDDDQDSVQISDHSLDDDDDSEAEAAPTRRKPKAALKPLVNAAAFTQPGPAQAFGEEEEGEESAEPVKEQASVVPSARMSFAEMQAQQAIKQEQERKELVAMMENSEEELDTDEEMDLPPAYREKRGLSAMKTKVAVALQQDKAETEAKRKKGRKRHSRQAADEDEDSEGQFGDAGVLQQAEGVERPASDSEDNDMDITMPPTYTAAVITIDQGNGYRPSDDDSDLEIDSNVYFGSGNNNDKQGRNTKKKLLDEYTQKQDERVAEKNHHLSKNGQLRVFRDSNTKDDQVGHQVYDLVEKANADFKKAEEEKRDKMRLEQRRELEKQTAIAREFALFAEQGEVFYKYGRQGFPRARRLTVILMKDHKTVEARWGPGNSFIQLRKHDAVLLDGKQTKVFRRKVAKKAQNSLCFSLANSSRTLDVEARSQIIKDKWFRGLKLLVLSLHHS